MRIGMMADAYKPHVSGITNYIDLNKRHLERAGHDVFVFTFGDLEHRDDEPRVIRSPGLPIQDTGFYLSFRYNRAAKRLLQTMDVVHVHHPFLSGRSKPTCPPSAKRWTWSSRPRAAWKKSSASSAWTAPSKSSPTAWN
ncbi:MAG: hypothetical protein DWB59_05645 [Anaerolineae bacterium]|nr:hypothetical protein [Anaerolineae bacterium]